MSHSIDEFKPGQRVALTQQLPRTGRSWTTRIEGEVVRSEQKKTGSWYAHSKDDRLWLDRLVVRKDDGELVTCNLDQYTHVDILPAPDPAPEPESEAEPEAAPEPEAAEPESEAEEAAADEPQS